MRFWIVYFFICLSIQVANAQYGIYAVEGFEWGAVLMLKENGTFNYSYHVSGCQGEVSGRFEVDAYQNIQFISDEKYTQEYLKKQEMSDKAEWDSLNTANGINLSFIKLAPCYPDLNEGNWKFTKKGLKARSEIKCACLPTKGLLYRKIEHK